MSVCIELLPIKNVSQVDMYRRTGKNHLYIEFFIHQDPYYLTLDEIDGVFQPMHVFHTNGKSKDCQFCSGIGMCQGLDPYRDFLFYWLIEFPTIRLFWLFMPHQKKGEGYEF